MMDTISRSLAKTISWRILAFFATALLVWLFTGRLELALTVGSLEALGKMFLYFAHERLWIMVPFGKKVQREVPIPSSSLEGVIAP